MPRSPGPESEAPPPLLVETLFTIDVATRVCVTPCNDGRLCGVEWVKTDWGTESQVARVA